MNFTVTSDRQLVRVAGGSVRYVVATIEVHTQAGDDQRFPLNIALVIDRSGSMEGPKLEQAREAAAYVVRQLRPQDRFSVVAYDDSVDVLVPSTAANLESCRHAARAIERLTAGSTTDLTAGWLRGCQQVAEYIATSSLSRSLLLTDGLANRGITDHATICHHAAELRTRGITTSTFGIGEHFDEVLLSAMAEAGGGNFRFIRKAEDIPLQLRQELQENLAVVAPDTAIEVKVPAGISVSSLNDFPVTNGDAGVYRIRIGDLVSGQIIEPIIRLRFSRGDEHARRPVAFTLTDPEGVLDAGATTLEFEYAGHRANNDQPRNRSVDRRVAAIYAARVKREALALNRDGDFRGAGNVIGQCLKRVRAYAGDDPDLLDIVADLEAAQQRYSRDMDSMSRKIAHSLSLSTVKGRSAYGSTRRRAGRPSLVVVPYSAVSAAAARVAVDALAADEHLLLGSLRLSRSWPQWCALLPPARRLSPVQENELVDAAQQRWMDEGLRLARIIHETHKTEGLRCGKKALLDEPFHIQEAFACETIAQDSVFSSRTCSVSRSWHGLTSPRAAPMGGRYCSRRAMSAWV